jgi:fumarate hydratase subunit alpha
MRKIQAKTVTEVVSRLFQQANFELGDDVLDALEKARRDEVSPRGREVIDEILKNARVATDETLPLCQDSGMAVVFLDLGQEVSVVGGDLYDAVDEGVRQAYNEGYLRKSVVSQPFSARPNTGDNTPAVVHADIVPGDRLRVTVMPKGAGAENFTRLAMLLPAAGREGIVDFVVGTVEEAWSNPCPPVIVGVGIGGTAEKALLLAKRTLLRRVGEPSPDAETADLEREILARVNALGIGPMGYGGSVTALAVHAEVFPAHIASLPVAVNLQCHSARHRQATI